MSGSISKKNIAGPGGDQTHDLLITIQTCIKLSHQSRQKKWNEEVQYSTYKELGSIEQQTAPDKKGHGNPYNLWASARQKNNNKKQNGCAPSKDSYQIDQSLCCVLNG